MEQLTQPKLRNIIANTSLFRMLSDDQLDLVAEQTSPVRARTNACVVNQGDPTAGTFWVVYGQVKLALYGQHGNEKTVAILGAGKCFGLGESLLDSPYAACVKSTAESLLLHTSRQVVLELAEQNADFAREMMNCLGRQIGTLLRDIETYSLPARQRLAAYLLRQGSPEHGDEIELVAKKVLVASRLSVTPETLSHLLSDLTAEGLIRVAGRRITILDWERMAALAQ